MFASEYTKHLFDIGIFSFVLIYHVAEPDVWAHSTGDYAPESLAREGFVHCSTADQLPDVMRRYYNGRRDLVLLELDAEVLGDLVVFEDLYGHGEEFPHVYGPLPTEAIVRFGVGSPDLRILS